MSRVVLHIGTHKTGTTSLQEWATTHPGELRRSTGLGWWRGMAWGAAVELACLCLRPELDLAFRQWHPESREGWWLDLAREHVAGQLRRGPLLASAEALSYARSADEVRAVADLLGPGRVEAVVVLRERDDFLRSYAAGARACGLEPSDDRDSAFYMGADSWLADHEATVAPWLEVLGADAVHLVCYEDALARHGSTIPAVLEPWSARPPRLWQGFWRNSST